MAETGWLGGGTVKKYEWGPFLGVTAGCKTALAFDAVSGCGLKSGAAWRVACRKSTHHSAPTKKVGDF